MPGTTPTMIPMRADLVECRSVVPTMNVLVEHRHISRSDAAVICVSLYAVNKICQVVSGNSNWGLFVSHAMSGWAVQTVALTAR